MSKIIERFLKKLKDNEEVVYATARNLTIVYFLAILTEVLGLFQIGHYINIDLFFYLIASIDLLAIFLFKENKNNTERVEQLVNFLFIFSMILYAATISNLDFLNFLHELLSTQLNQILHMIFITGITSLYLKKKTQTINSKATSRYSKIPFAKKIFEWKEKKAIYILLFILILLLFTMIKIPTIEKSFGGVKNSGKYGSYLPRAIYMYEEGDIFHDENKAYKNIFGDYDTSSFGNFPFYQWTFFVLMPLTQFISFELLVRGLMTLFGIVLLTSIYFVFTKIFDKRIALLGTFLIAVNPLFHVITHTTTMDLFGLMFTFIGLSAYLMDKKDSGYLLCGFAILSKYSFMLIAFPIFFFIIFFREKERVYETLKLCFFSFLPLLIHEILIKPIPTQSTTEGWIRLIIGIALLLLAYYFTKKMEVDLKKIFGRMDEKLGYAIMGLSFLAISFFLRNKILFYSKEFLTDEFLLFNWQVYEKMFELLRETMPDFAFFLIPLGLILFLVDKKRWQFSLPIMIGCLSYFVIAIKSIWFHFYYKHFFIIIAAMMMCYIFLLIDETGKNRIITLLSVSILVALIAIPSVESSRNILKEELEGIKETANYIKETMGENEKILREEEDIKLLQLYGVKNPQVYVPFKGEDLDKLRKELKSKNFSQVMKEHGVRYYVSVWSGNFNVFDNLFTEEKRDRDEFSLRRRLILREIGQEQKSEEKVMEPEEDASEYFELERIIGNFYIYRVR